MKFNRLIIACIAITIAGLFTSCEDNIIVTPSPTSEIFPDCSYSFTTSVQDTTWSLPPPPPFSFQNFDYLGYQIKDISFNPTNPNELAIAFWIHDNQDALPSYEEGTLVVTFNLCTGEQNTIISPGLNSLYGVASIDWGNNDNLLIGTTTNILNSGQLSIVSTIKSNGDSLVAIPYAESGMMFISNIKWAYDEKSFFVRGNLHPVSQVNLIGEELIADIGIGAVADFEVISANKMLYAGADIGIYDLEDGSGQILASPNISSSQMDISYCPNLNSIFWSSDTLLSLIDQNLNTTDYIHSFEYQKERAWGACSSKNGYLAYIVEVISPSLSTSTTLYRRTEIRFINPDGTDERRLVLDFE